MNIDWEAIGTLRDVSASYDIRTDPLRVLVTSAKQSHMGPLDIMRIEMLDGVIYGPAEIQNLATRPDRKWD
jgi:hypothetical protein